MVNGNIVAAPCGLLGVATAVRANSLSKIYQTIKQLVQYYYSPPKLKELLIRALSMHVHPLAIVFDLILSLNPALRSGSAAPNAHTSEDYNGLFLVGCNLGALPSSYFGIKPLFVIYFVNNNTDNVRNAGTKMLSSTKQVSSRVNVLRVSANIGW